MVGCLNEEEFRELLERMFVKQGTCLVSSLSISDVYCRNIGEALTFNKLDL